MLLLKWPDQTGVSWSFHWPIFNMSYVEEKTDAPHLRSAIVLDGKQATILHTIGVLYFFRSQSTLVLNDAFLKGDCVFRAQKRLLRLWQRPRKKKPMRTTFCQTNTLMTISTRILILMTGDLQPISRIFRNDQAKCLSLPCVEDGSSSWCTGYLENGEAVYQVCYGEGRTFLEEASTCDSYCKLLFLGLILLHCGWCHLYKPRTSLLALVEDSHLAFPQVGKRLSGQSTRSVSLSLKQLSNRL